MGWRAVGAVGLLVVGLTVAAAAVFFEDLVILAISPRGEFNPLADPREPNYADPAAWSALPQSGRAADAAVRALPARDQSAAPVDVFYVHPTSYVGPRWNAPVDDAALNAATDQLSTRLQATVFNSCCAIYAPRYRQANGTAFIDRTPSGASACTEAYLDVRRAFRVFLSSYSRGRPFVLAGHSQGAVLLRQLLREEVWVSAALRQRLVAAYLIGAPVSKQELVRQLPSIPVCTSPSQTGCLVSFNARGPRYRPGKLAIHELPGDEPGEQVCVNPLTWSDDGAAVAAAQNEGAVFLEAEPPVLLPHFASAQCQGGTLVVSELGKAPRSLVSRLLDHALGAQNYHPIEYQMFYANLRHNAEQRVAAYLQSRGMGSLGTAAPPAPQPR